MPKKTVKKYRTRLDRDMEKAGVTTTRPKSKAKPKAKTKPKTRAKAAPKTKKSRSFEEKVADYLYKTFFKK